jgi:hypothetical protein
MLQVVPRNGWKSTAPGESRCELGSVDPLTTPRLSRDFTLHNAGSAPITIASVQPTCGCTAVFSGGATSAPGAGGLTLAPADETTVHTVLDTTIVHPGAFDKLLYIFVRQHTGPVLTLHIVGAITPPIAFSRPILDFGRAVAGQPKSITITATLSAEAAKRLNHPKLIVTNPDIQVTTAPPSATASASGISQTFTLTLAADARIGPVTGRALFVDADSKTPPGAAAMPIPGQSPESAYLAGLYVPLVGEVTGHIAALPMVFVFGSVPAGQSASRQVTLIGRTPAILDGLRFDCSSPYVSVHLIPKPSASAQGSQAPQSGLDPSRLLEATLSPNAPVGALKAEITVTTLTHERLVLPILLDIAAH